MDDRMEARLRDEVIVAGYEALPDVYEWLIPDAKLTPEGSVAALGDLVQSLPSNARVLDCSSGPGQLAVGLARLGLDVVATDASAGIVRRTQELADEHSVPLQALRVAWDECSLGSSFGDFDMINMLRRRAPLRAGLTRRIGRGHH
jgi:2-polyprenyl-3-methyl-5-hydroxy-6-metoxy-1,4-benzoquinol methylase